MATALETYLLQLINQERAKVGAQALVFDAELSAAAQKHTDWQDTANTLSHTGSGGSSPGDRATASGYDWKGYAENVAMASDRGSAGLDKADIDTLHSSLMNSPGHKSNILDASMKEIGLGLSMDDRTAWVTELFGNPSAKESAEGDKGGGSAPPPPVPVPSIPIKAGLGSQVLTGTAGKDTFVFTSVRDGMDKIVNFKVGQDKLDLHTIKGVIEQHDTKMGIVIEIDPGPGHDIGMVTLLGVHEPLSASHFVH